MSIEVQFLLTLCIDRIIAHEFTYPLNCGFHFIHEKKLNRTNISLYIVIVIGDSNYTSEIFENATA